MKNKNFSRFVKDLAVGFCLGIANIIPGVSGGTFLLIFKIYERLITSLNSVNKSVLFELFSLFFALIKNAGRHKSFSNLIAFLKKHDFLFLLKLVVGALFAILILSTIMKYLLIHQFSVTYGLFFSLILVSIMIPYKMLKEKKIYLLFFLVLGAGLTLFVAASVNPYEKAQKKSDIYKTRYEQSVDKTEVKTNSQRFRFTGKYTPAEYLYAALCGAVAVSAMVLPGISGSLVLILMGEYFLIISAISGLKTLNLDHFLFLSCFSFGMIFGLLLFAKLVGYVFKKYYDPTMAFLLGLMVGSLYVLWPFKKYLLIDQYVKKDGIITVVNNSKIYTNINILPENTTDLTGAVIAFIVGCLIMYFFVKKEMNEA